LDAVVKTTLALLLTLIGCLASAADPSRAFDYFAQTEIDGYTIKVGLIRSHPFLAEYKKFLTVTRQNKFVGAKQCADTGGFTSFYLLRNGTSITILDGFHNGLVLDTATGAVSDVKADDLPKDWDKQSFGRFMFINDPARNYDRTYKWFTAEALPKWVTESRKD
jgi:hypothetical protein